jgi:hypothetical protein
MGTNSLVLENDANNLLPVYGSRISSLRKRPPSFWWSFFDDGIDRLMQLMTWNQFSSPIWQWRIVHQRRCQVNIQLRVVKLIPSPSCGINHEGKKTTQNVQDNPKCTDMVVQHNILIFAPCEANGDVVTSIGSQRNFSWCRSQNVPIDQNLCTLRIGIDKDALRVTFKNECTTRS